MGRLQRQQQRAARSLEFGAEMGELVTTRAVSLRCELVESAFIDVQPGNRSELVESAF